ncbi:MAG: hypothetical protein ACQEQD_04550 [Bacillota bacterium]
MRGFAEMVKSCWKVQKNFNLTDRQMVELLGILQSRYEEKSRQREQIAGLIEETTKMIKKEYNNE